MTDLFVYTADADAQAVFRSILARHAALGMHKVSYTVDRHVGRDPGMVKDGPELVRLLAPKNVYRKVLLIWDYQGANWKHPPEECEGRIQKRLDEVTWKSHSGAVVIVPELEEWLWHNIASLCKWLETGAPEIAKLVTTFCANEAPDQVQRTKPKELFEFVLYQKQKRRPLPRDFEQIAKTASLRKWQQSPSFAQVVSILQSWFHPK